jgi:hypothetical protein
MPELVTALQMEGVENHLALATTLQDTKRF